MCDLEQIYLHVYDNINKILNTDYFLNVCKNNKQFIIKLIDDGYGIVESCVLCISIHINILNGL
jgi:hypothetical protein